MSHRVVTNRKKRRSLNTVFVAALSALFVIFILLLGFTYSQLFGVKQELERVSKEAIPEIILFDEVAKKASFLAFYTQQISKADSPPALRIAQTNLTRVITEIDWLLQQINADTTLQREFNTMQLELVEMTQLVKKRLETVAQVTAAESDLYQLFEKSDTLTKSTPSWLQANASSFYSDFSKLINQTGGLINYTRLNDIRDSATDIETKHNELVKKAEDLDADVKRQAHELLDEFSQVVLDSDDGIIALRVLELRIEGRTTGRGNFIEKLAFEFARTLSFKGSMINAQVITNANDMTQSISRQMNLLWVGFAAALILAGIIAMILKRRVITRLILLKRKVSDQSDDSSCHISIEGNDEITDIEQSFEEFVATIDTQKQKLSTLAMQDGLTGIANRRAFDETFGNSIEMAHRTKSPLALLIIDVDFFKDYNDTYGHQKGDETLIKVAEILHSSLRRQVDFVARYGGEEFVCILPATQLADARKIAEQLRLAVEQCQMPHINNIASHCVTVSIGGAMIERFEQDQYVIAESLLENADNALYKAKNSGRNQVFFATGDEH